MSNARRARPNRPDGPVVGRAVLAAVAAVSGVTACVLAGTTAAHSSAFTTTLMVWSAVLAITAAARPDTHIALGLVAVTVWAWLRASPDVATARTVAVTVMLLVFHEAIALLASTPPAAVPGRAVLQRWALRTLWVGAGTTLVWLLVAALQGERRAASPTALSMAVVGVAGAAMWARHRALTAGGVPSPQLNPPGDPT